VKLQHHDLLGTHCELAFGFVPSNTMTFWAPTHCEILHVRPKNLGATSNTMTFWAPTTQLQHHDLLGTHCELLGSLPACLHIIHEPPTP